MDLFHAHLIDVITMKNGTMRLMKNAEMKPVDMVMTLSNGTRVAMDGTITLRDGTSRMLMDGEAMTLDGEMRTVEDVRRDDAMEGDLGNRMKDDYLLDAGRRVHFIFRS